MASKGKGRAPDFSLGTYDDEDSNAVAFRERMLHKLRAGHVATHKITAWCPCTGLLAYPAPRPRSHSRQQHPTASTSLLPHAAATSSPSICMTLPSLPSHTDDEYPEVSFTLTLPEAPGAILRNSGHEHISHLSFSPDGNYLAVFTSFKSDVNNNNISQRGSARFLLYQRGNELNPWSCTFDWDARRAKANLVAASSTNTQGNTGVRLDSAAVLDVRWLQKEAKTPTQSAREGRKRNHDALLDLSGTLTLTAVLQSNELFLVHLPFQAIQPQIYVLSLDDSLSTTQDLSAFGTAFSPLPLAMPSTIGASTTLLDGGMLDSLGMNLIGTAPIDPLQKALNNLTSNTNGNSGLQNVQDSAVPFSLSNIAMTEATKSTRLASIGPCTTLQKDSNLPEAPSTLFTEFLLAYQEAYQPKLLRQTTSGSAAVGTVLSSNTTAMLLDPNPVTGSIGVVQASQSGPENLQGLSQTSADMAQTTSQSLDQKFGLPDLQSFGLSTGFETGYGDLNLSALDDMFDNEFGNGGDNGVNIGGLSSTLNSINEDFASSFPSTTEPNGAPSPSKKELSSINQGDGSGSFDIIGNGMNRSESPSKSILDGSHNLESRGNSPRKSLIVHGAEDDLPEFLEGALDGGRVEAMSEIKISQIRIEWTEYGVLSVAVMPASTITSQTACLLESTAPPVPSLITHLYFSSDNQGDASTLVTVSYTLSNDTRDALSRIQSYSISQEPFMLSEAFSTLEGRKADPDPSILQQTQDWVVKPIHTAKPENLARHDWAFLDVWEQAGEMKGTFLDREGSLHLLHSTSDHENDKTLPLPRHFPLSVTISPSSHLALACAIDAFDEASIVGKPAIFALQPGHARSLLKVDDEAQSESKANIINPNSSNLPQALIDGLVGRKSIRDVLILADRLSTDGKVDLLRQSWKIASSLLQGARVEQTRLLWPLLGVQRQLHSGSSVAILDDIMQLSSCLRILQDNKATFRNASQQAGSQIQVNETFDGDAVWPIIGHITWMFNLWDRIITKMTSDELDRDWSSASFLIMHPLPRMLQQRLVRLIARFANYMMNLRDGTLLVPVSENATAAVSETELAKTVLGDIIVSQRQKTQEWNNMLQGLTNRLGTEWTDDISKGREALLTLQLPSQLERTAREMAFGMKQKLLPLVNVKAVATNLKTGTGKDEVDVITTVPLKGGNTSLRRCTLCLGKTHLYLEGNRSEWESSKRRSCVCGGQWVAAP